MPFSSSIKRALPAAIGGAVALAALSATPATANSSGWWYSSSSAAKGYYNDLSGRTTACDLKRDGYKAVTQILDSHGYLVTSVTDANGSGTCTWRDLSLFEGTHQIRVCLAKAGTTRPVKCGSAHKFYARQ